jgi:hypothetical protein
MHENRRIVAEIIKKTTIKWLIASKKKDVKCKVKKKKKMCCM